MIPYIEKGACVLYICIERMVNCSSVLWLSWLRWGLSFLDLCRAEERVLWVVECFSMCRFHMLQIRIVRLVITLLWGEEKYFIAHINGLFRLFLRRWELWVLIFYKSIETLHGWTSMLLGIRQTAFAIFGCKWCLREKLPDAILDEKWYVVIPKIDLYYLSIHSDSWRYEETHDKGSGFETETIPLEIDHLNLRLRVTQNRLE